MNAAVVLSGGIGQRMGLDIPKQYMHLNNKPILVHTMEQFQYCNAVDDMVVVADDKWKKQIMLWKKEYDLSKLRAVVSAGENRQYSLFNGLLAIQINRTGIVDGVVVQDAVRPLTRITLIESLLQNLQYAPCVLPVLSVKDTVYFSRDGQNIDGFPNRSTLFAGQAPEAFHFQEYLRLYMDTPSECWSTMSGSCQLPCHAGWKIKMIPGDPDNIKITYPSDMVICGKLLQERSI